MSKVASNAQREVAFRVLCMSHHPKRASTRRQTLAWGYGACAPYGHDRPARNLKCRLTAEYYLAYSMLSEHRLLTITGLPGIGKTRIAIELPRRFQDLYDETWFVDLLSVRRRQFRRVADCPSSQPADRGRRRSVWVGSPYPITEGTFARTRHRVASNPAARGIAPLGYRFLTFS